MKRLAFILTMIVIVGLTTLVQAGIYPGTQHLYDNGGGLIYDEDLNITWLQEPNNNNMTWQQANDWAAGLTTGGVSGWRLPSTVDGLCVGGYNGQTCGHNNSTGEMGHLFYTELGNIAYYTTTGAYPQPGWGLTNKGPFTALQADSYWYGTEYALNTIYTWDFGFGDGSQGTIYKEGNFKLYALAVHDGNVRPVPIPAAVWLLGSGLLGLIGLRRKYLG